MSQEPYPLKQILEVKKKRVEEAEKVVIEKKQILEKEEAKLKQQEAIRDEVLHHYQDKLAQLRQVLDEGTTSTTIKQMKDYIKVVQERLAKEEAKVKEQRKKVEAATADLESARKVLKEKRKEVEKFEIHEEEWTKEMKVEAGKKEEKDLDEIGTTIFYGQRKKKGK